MISLIVEHMDPKLLVLDRALEVVQSELAYIEMMLDVMCYGIQYPILVNATNNGVVDGAHRVTVALALHYETVPVVKADPVVIDLWWAATRLNKDSGIPGTATTARLLAELASIGQLSGIGCGEAELRPFRSSVRT